MAACLRTRVEMLPILSAALDRGDELHGQVAAVQAAIVGVFDDALADTSKTYLEAATQFGLNIVMATAALMLGAGAGVPGSTMVTACGGNGQRLGYQTADATGQWITVPATAPIGPKMNDSARALPAIGDSAVIDALGFGAACLRFAPTLPRASVAGSMTPFLRRRPRAIYRPASGVSARRTQTWPRHSAAGPGSRHYVGHGRSRRDRGFDRPRRRVLDALTALSRAAPPACPRLVAMGRSATDGHRRPG